MNGEKPDRSLAIVDGDRDQPHRIVDGRPAVGNQDHVGKLAENTADDPVFVELLGTYSLWGSSRIEPKP